MLKRRGDHIARLLLAGERFGKPDACEQKYRAASTA
jgi:hypothetical protein